MIIYSHNSSEQRTYSVIQNPNKVSSKKATFWRTEFHNFYSQLTAILTDHYLVVKGSLFSVNYHDNTFRRGLYNNISSKVLPNTRHNKAALSQSTHLCISCELASLWNLRCSSICSSNTAMVSLKASSAWCFIWRSSCVRECCSYRLSYSISFF